MKCEKCNSTEGIAHKFYYGKKIGEVSDSIPSAQKVTIIGYKIGGSKDVTLCNKCIFNYRLTRIAKTMGFILFGVMLVLVGGPPPKFTGVGGVAGLQVIGLLIAAFSLLYLMPLFITSKKEMGEDLAISLNKIL